MNREELVTTYFKCMGKKIREPLNDILSENLAFISKHSTYTDRDVMLNEVWPYLGKTEASDFQFFHGDNQDLMVKYVITPDGKKWTNVEHFTFHDGKIIQIEVFEGYELE